MTVCLHMCVYVATVTVFVDGNKQVDCNEYFMVQFEGCIFWCIILLFWCIICIVYYFVNSLLDIKR